MSYAREYIAQMEGYTPGEQPQGKPLVKLNTNENPYPPSPKVLAACREFDASRLRLYPDPSGKMIREAASRAFGIPAECVLCGNGSDDLLTIALRTFVGANEALAYTVPSYSLYPVLAELEDSRKHPVQLAEDFGFPIDAIAQAGGARLLLLACPNAPTGTLFDKELLEATCREFKGIVWIDEAYADFAPRNCLDLVQKYPNVIVSRTMSKSFSLAGLRLGLAFANQAVIQEMHKVRDSYNVDMITQHLATAALEDMAYMKENVKRIQATRDWLAAELIKLGANVLPSAANFLFVEPRRPAQEMFHALRQHGYLVRYFNQPRISQYIRITMGTREDMEGFLDTYRQLITDK